MKFSIITPTHKITPYLVELYESILCQTYEDWEWVLFLNNGASIQELPPTIVNDARVKITESYVESTKVGHIKNLAFNLGVGDVLVEVDHDDFLHQDCLEELYKAYQDPEVGFVYSDDLLYDQRGPDKLFFSSKTGWVGEWVSFRGENYFKPDGFKPTSQALSFIWYAPDHVRSWRKSVYDDLGGHNKDLSVCDDHELLIRTYLKTKMVHIPKVLYYYRLINDSSNTYLSRNSEIQDITKNLFEQYARKLAERDAENNGLLKVRLGTRLEDYLSIGDGDYAEVIWDLNKGIPLEDNSAYIIDAECLPLMKDKNFFIEEVQRVLCDTGWAFLTAPSTDGRGAFQDPRNVSYWNENSFWYYCRDQQIPYSNSKARFQEFLLKTHYPNKFFEDNKIPIVEAWLCAVKSNTRRPHTKVEI